MSKSPLLAAISLERAPPFAFSERAVLHANDSNIYYYSKTWQMQENYKS